MLSSTSRRTGYTYTMLDSAYHLHLSGISTKNDVVTYRSIPVTMDLTFSLVTHRSARGLSHVIVAYLVAFTIRLNREFGV